MLAYHSLYEKLSKRTSSIVDNAGKITLAAINVISVGSSFLISTENVETKSDVKER